MAECSHNCSTCSQKCSKESLLAPMNKASNVISVTGAEKPVSLGSIVLPQEN